MVSIIIPSYNTKQLVLSCLSSIAAHFPENAYEVIVIDNASADDSVAAIKKLYPKVQIIINIKNVGFAKAINAGVKKAKGEHLLFLNSDTEVTEDFLLPIEKLFEKDKKIGAIGVRLQDTSGESEQSFGSFYTFPSLFSLLFLPKKHRRLHKTTEVDWISGGCFFISRALFTELNGFDENIFMYVEDVEICYRIKKMGYTVLYVPEHEVIHKGQGSSNRAFAITQIYKGILYFYKKHKSRFAYMCAKLMLVKKAFLSIIIGFVSGNKTLVKTYSEALRNI